MKIKRLGLCLITLIYLFGTSASFADGPIHEKTFVNNLYTLAEEMQLSITPPKSDLDYTFSYEERMAWETDISAKQYKRASVVIEGVEVGFIIKMSYGIYSIFFTFTDPPTSAQECVASAFVMAYGPILTYDDEDTLLTGSDLLKKAVESLIEARAYLDLAKTTQDEATRFLYESLGRHGSIRFDDYACHTTFEDGVYHLQIDTTNN